MIISLGHHLNSVVVVSIPALFEDDRPRECTLVGIEVSGVWLAGLELAKKSHADAKYAASPIFVPFAQIIYLMEAGEAGAQKPSPDRQPHHAEPKQKRAQGGVQKKKREA
jgi:hypothetical protein